MRELLGNLSWKTSAMNDMILRTVIRSSFWKQCGGWVAVAETGSREISGEAVNSYGGGEVGKRTPGCLGVSQVFRPLPGVWGWRV